jgi:ADP-ribosylglycohydrolase
MNNEILRRQGAVLLPAIAYGDTTGLADDTRAIGYVAERLLSDVTERNMTVAKTLVRENGFNLDALAASDFDDVENDVLTKLAPLAYWQNARKTPVRESYQQYDQLTDVNHDSALMRLTTRVHGDVLNYLLNYEYDKRQFLEMLDGSLGLHEFETDQPGMLREMLAYLRGNLITENILSHVDKDGVSAPETLAKAYGAFMGHKGQFMDSILEADKLGGDTSGTASIVAAMSVFTTKNTLRMPVDHQNIERLDELKSVSRKLANAALKK